MTQYQLAHDGAYRVYLTEFGIDRTYIGPPFAKPRAAIAYSDQLDAAANGAGQSGSEDPGMDTDGASRSAAAFSGRPEPSEREAGL